MSLFQRELQNELLHGDLCFCSPCFYCVVGFGQMLQVRADLSEAHSAKLREEAVPITPDAQSANYFAGPNALPRLSRRRKPRVAPLPKRAWL